MHLSLNEIDAQVRKAARGAGLAWGLAEEAGRATRWLLAHRIAALPAAADLLEAHARGSIGAALDAGGRTSPFTAGPALSDQARAIAAGQAIAVHEAAWPIFLAAFAAHAARLAGAPLALAWSGGRLVLDPAGAPRGALTSLAAAEACETIVCSPAGQGAPPAAAPPAWEGVEIDPALWERFDRLAAATYVPASAVSRERGAGAGAIDND